MIEAGAALLISLIAFSIGYGVMKEKLFSLKALSDERYLHVLKELETLKNSHKVLTEIKISLAEILKDIQNINTKLPK